MIHIEKTFIVRTKHLLMQSLSYYDNYKRVLLRLIFIFMRAVYLLFSIFTRLALFGSVILKGLIFGVQVRDSVCIHTYIHICVTQKCSIHWIIKTSNIIDNWVASFHKTPDKRLRKFQENNINNNMFAMYSSIFPNAWIQSLNFYPFR